MAVGNLEEASFTGDFGDGRRRVLETEHLFVGALRGEPGGGGGP